MALEPCFKLQITTLRGRFCTIILGSCGRRLLVSPTYATFGIVSFLFLEPVPLAPCGFLLKKSKIPLIIVDSRLNISGISF